MAIRMSEAKALCTKPEFELVQASSPKEIAQLTPARLRGKVQRARKLRDKYESLARSQRRESRGKQDPRRTRRATGNERTVQKRDLFAEVLTRFEAKLAKVEAAAEREEARKAKAAARKTSGRKKTGKKASKKAAARTAKKGTGAGRTTKKASKKPTKTAATKASKKSGTKRAAAGTLAAAGGLSGASPSRKGKKKTAKTATRAKAAARDLSLETQSEQTKGVRVQKTRQRSNIPKIQGHTSSATRRSQAKRDSK